MSRELFPELRAEKMRIRKTALQLGARRPVADDDLRARQVEAQHRLQILFDRHAADVEKDRPRQTDRAAIARMVERVIDAARPDDDALEAALREFVAN